MSAAVSPHRLSSGVVVVSLVQRKLKYLLLRAYRNWDFPKGWSRRVKRRIDAALREVREETTLDDLSFDWGLEFMETGPYNKGKISRYYIARSKRMEVLLPIIRISAGRSTMRRAGSISPERSPWSRRACNRWCSGHIPSSITSQPQSANRC